MSTKLLVFLKLVNLLKMRVLTRIVQGTGLGWVSTSSKDFAGKTLARMIFGIHLPLLHSACCGPTWKTTSKARFGVPARMMVMLTLTTELMQAALEPKQRRHYQKSSIQMY